MEVGVAGYIFLCEDGTFGLVGGLFGYKEDERAGGIFPERLRDRPDAQICLSGAASSKNELDSHYPTSDLSTDDKFTMRVLVFQTLNSPYAVIRGVLACLLPNERQNDYNQVEAFKGKLIANITYDIDSGRRLIMNAKKNLFRTGLFVLCAVILTGGAMSLFGAEEKTYEIQNCVFFIYYNYTDFNFLW